MSELRCPECGYLLTALTEPRCPECGINFDRTKLLAEQSKNTKVFAGVLIVGFMVLIFFVGILASSAGYPRPWSPLPITVVFPAFMTGSIILAPLPLALAWAIWTAPLIGADRKVRWWSICGYAVLVALSALWYFGGWSYGLEYQGKSYVVAVSTINAISTIALTGLLILNRLRAGFPTNLAFHVLVGCWLASYAFPYLGELP